MLNCELTPPACPLASVFGTFGEKVQDEEATTSKSHSDDLKEDGKPTRAGQVITLHELS